MWQAPLTQRKSSSCSCALREKHGRGIWNWMLWVQISNPRLQCTLCFAKFHWPATLPDRPRPLASVKSIANRDCQEAAWTRRTCKTNFERKWIKALPQGSKIVLTTMLSTSTFLQLGKSRLIKDRSCSSKAKGFKWIYMNFTLVNEPGNLKIIPCKCALWFFLRFLRTVQDVLMPRKTKQLPVPHAAVHAKAVPRKPAMTIHSIHIYIYMYVCMYVCMYVM